MELYAQQISLFMHEIYLILYTKRHFLLTERKVEKIKLIWNADFCRCGKKILYCIFQNYMNIKWIIGILFIYWIIWNGVDKRETHFI